MRRKLLAMMFTLMIGLPTAAVADTRIIDITGVRGIDENLLQGVGLVVGLNGKGDKGNTVKKLAKQIHARVGVDFDEKDIEARNMAIVQVTSKLPPFARIGQKLDVTVAAQGAESLEGGVLFACYLFLSGTDPSKTPPVAIAQGPVLVGNTGQVGRGNVGGSASASIPTVGKAVNGGVVLKEIPQNYLMVSYDKQGNPVSKWFELVLDRPNFFNASEIAKSINKKFARELGDGVQIAKALSAGEVMVTIPRSRWEDIIEYFADVQKITLNHIENEAVVVVNEKTGGITTSGEVKLNACTVSYNNFNITIAKDQDLAQVLQQLNASLTTKDQIEIIKTLNSAGHLRATLKVE